MKSVSPPPLQYCFLCKIRGLAYWRSSLTKASRLMVLWFSSILCFVSNPTDYPNSLAWLVLTQVTVMYNVATCWLEHGLHWREHKLCNAEYKLSRRTSPPFQGAYNSSLKTIINFGMVNNYLLNGNKVPLYFTEMNSRNFIFRAKREK